MAGANMHDSPRTSFGLMDRPPRGLKETLQRIVLVWRTEGVRSLWFRILGELGYRRTILMERRFDPTPRRPPAPKITTEMLPPERLAEYLAFRPTPGADVVLRRWSHGDRCFVQRDSGAIVSACWISLTTAWIEYLDVEIELPEGAAYGYEYYTIPGARNQSLSIVFGEDLKEFYSSRGVVLAIGAVVPENKPALRASHKIGYRRIGMIGRIRFGPWQRTFLKLDDPSYPIRLKPRRT